MKMLRRLFEPFARDCVGTMAIETAIVAPVLAMMALGAFEASSIVSRQQQLQSAASEAAEIILAAAGGTGVSSSSLETIIESSLNLQPSQLAIAQRFRCDAASSLVATKPSPPGCAASKPIYTYVQLTLTETYTPFWTNFGIGEAVNFQVVRTVQVS